MDLFKPLASLLAFFYDLVPSYAAAIALLTLTVMIVLLPLTLKATRSQLAMQKLAPEIKKLQDKHKNDRQKLNEEVMAVYKDNKINPLGGCLPMLLQLPVFFILYSLISGMTHRTAEGIIAPKHLNHASDLYQSLIQHNGAMKSLGVDLSQRAASHHNTLLAALPFYGLVLLMVLLQYVQTAQILRRSPSADTPMAQQMRTMQKYLPPVFGLFSFGIPAGVVLYWVISSCFRIAQQWGMYKWDPLLKTKVASATKEAEAFLKEDDAGGRAQKGPQKKPPISNSKNKKKRKGR